ncbi:hypothetical protein IMZ48_17285 [Candidatus Bathyarchaeota archaeon]|nr:hypothetical protein [Candidatus Bathyarchaeota archaeon]
MLAWSVSSPPGRDNDDNDGHDSTVETQMINPLSQKMKSAGTTIQLQLSRQPTSITQCPLTPSRVIPRTTRIIERI